MFPVKIALMRISLNISLIKECQISGKLGLLNFLGMHRKMYALMAVMIAYEIVNTFAKRA